MKTKINFLAQPKFYQNTLGSLEGLYNGTINKHSTGGATPIPGCKAQAGNGSRTNGWGVYGWEKAINNTQLISVFDYYVHNSTSMTSIADFDTCGDAGGNTGTGRVHFAEGLDGSGNKTLYISAPENGTNGNLFYIVESASTTVLRVTDAQYPGNNSYPVVGGLVSMDGYIFVMDTDGNIWNSDNNNGTSWASQFVNAELNEDVGVFLAKYKNHLVAFGSRSTEFFYNGNYESGQSPLLPRRDLAFNIGASTANAAAMSNQQVDSLEDTLMWIGGGSTGEIGVYVMDNFRPKKVSTEQIDRALDYNHRNGSGEIRLKLLQIHGRVFAHLSLGAGSQEYLLYDLNNEFWSIVDNGALAGEIQGYAKLNSPVDFSNLPFFVKKGSNKLWYIRHGYSYDDVSTTTTESKTIPTMTIQTPTITDVVQGGPGFPFSMSNKKFLKSVHVEVEGHTVNTNSTGTYSIQSRTLDSRLTDGTNDYYRFGKYDGPFQLTVTAYESTKTSGWDEFAIKNIEIDIEDGEHS